MPYQINQELCSACHQCRVNCPVSAITFRNAKYWIDPEKCISCGTCVKYCHNGCISNPDAPPAPVEKHPRVKKSCDVCVIGAGAAGMVAAAKISDEGRKVIVLEKMHEVGGSAWYAAGYVAHWSKWHAAAGLSDPREQKYNEFLEKTAGHNVDPKLLKRMFWANTSFVDWMIDEHNYGDDYSLEVGPMGAHMEPHFEWSEASKRIDKMIGPGEGGWYITTHLRDSILAKGGEILYHTPAKHILTEENGAVSGVLAENPGGEVEISCRAIVVASGAFTRNREIMNKMQPMFYQNEGKEPVHIFTAAGCTGDGITMCEELGADIDYVNRRVNLFGPMRHPYPCVSLTVAMGASGFQVGSQGNPFNPPMAMKEVSPLTEDPKWYCWKIVDEDMAVSAIDAAIKEPPQSPGMDLGKFLKNWREVLEEEETAGAIVSADSLTELADKLGFDRADFLAQADAYNESVLHPDPVGPGGPEGMGPPPGMGERPKPQIFSGSKVYAIKLKLFHENAIGGMTIDENASVLRDGVPIPGLYAAGDTTRGIMIPGDVGVGYIEMVFSALTQALNEGYIAGTEAAAYTA